MQISKEFMHTQWRLLITVFIQGRRTGRIWQQSTIKLFFRVYDHEGKHLLGRKMLPEFPPTCLSNENLRWGRGWALSNDVVACHGDLVVPELL